MADAAHAAVLPGSMAVTQSRTSWGLELGRHRLTITRSHEARTMSAPTEGSRSGMSPRLTWPIAIGTFTSISAFGLFVFGAVASTPLLPRQHPRYSLSLAIPAPIAAAKPAKTMSAHRTRVTPVPAGASHDSNPSGPRFEGADEAYAVTAMRTGEFQDWLGTDGQRRFLSVGPEDIRNGLSCRDMVLLVRAVEGGSRTRSARRCVIAGSDRHGSPTPADEGSATAMSTPTGSALARIGAASTTGPSNADIEASSESLPSQ